MSFDWIEKEDLIEKYHVFASFYNVRLPGKIIECRNDLHIIDKTIGVSYSSTRKKPQLLMIMMNPGTSLPTNNDYIPPIYSESDSPLIKETEKVETEPDKTQYQVMRIMWNMGFTHARVINISDLRNPQSSDFENNLKSVQPLTSIHSIFSEQRKDELSEVFSNLDDDAVIFKAWGIRIVDSCSIFKDLVSKCLINLPDSYIKLGIEGKTNYHYRHPLPFPQWSEKPQKEWLKAAATLF